MELTKQKILEKEKERCKGIIDEIKGGMQKNVEKIHERKDEESYIGSEYINYTLDEIPKLNSIKGEIEEAKSLDECKKILDTFLLTSAERVISKIKEVKGNSKQTK